MAVTTIPTAGIANDAVDNTKLDLAANYAFTGTVSGAGDNAGMKLLATGASSSATSTLKIQSVFSTTYKCYKLIGRFQPASSGADMEGRFLNGSTATTDGEYRYICHNAYKSSSDAQQGANGGWDSTFWRWNRFGLQNASAFGYYIEANIWNPMASSTSQGGDDQMVTSIGTGYTNGNYVETTQVSVNYQSGGDMDGIQINFNPGDISEHWYAVYGVNLA